MWDVVGLGRYTGNRIQEIGMDAPDKIKYYNTPDGRLPDNNYPLWLERLYSKETASPEDGKPTGPLSPSKRTHGGSMVSFAKQLPPTALSYVACVE